MAQQINSEQYELDPSKFSQNILVGTMNSAWYMNADQSVELSEPISAQRNGVVLVWSAYTSGAPQNHSFNYTFIPKIHVALFDNGGIGFNLRHGTSASNVIKYVYVGDTVISGNAINGNSPNNAQVLRMVVGV